MDSFCFTKTVKSAAVFCTSSGSIQTVVNGSSNGLCTVSSSFEMPDESNQLWCHDVDGTVTVSTDVLVNNFCEKMHFWRCQWITDRQYGVQDEFLPSYGDPPGPRIDAYQCESCWSNYIALIPPMPSSKWNVFISRDKSIVRRLMI